MKAKFVNEGGLGFGNSAYKSEEDPHADFDAARGLLIKELRNTSIGDLLESPDILVSDELNSLISTELTDGEAFDNDSWKNIFMENYIGPIVDAFDMISKKVEELEKMEGVGDLNYPPKKKKGIFKR
jgi:hypothetical protein